MLTALLRLPFCVTSMPVTVHDGAPGSGPPTSTARVVVKSHPPRVEILVAGGEGGGGRERRRGGVGKFAFFFRLHYPRSRRDRAECLEDVVERERECGII